MAGVEENRDGETNATKKMSGWDALDEHIRKLQEKYEKEKRGGSGNGNGNGHQNHTIMTATVQGTKAATDMAVNQARDSEKKKSP
ncbi:hypothetical protein PG984_002885 [Apiospora sp. TS-2023a]